MTAPIEHAQDAVPAKESRESLRELDRRVDDFLKSQRYSPNHWRRFLVWGIVVVLTAYFGLYVTSGFWTVPAVVFADDAAALADLKAIFTETLVDRQSLVSAGITTESELQYRSRQLKFRRRLAGIQRHLDGGPGNPLGSYQNQMLRDALTQVQVFVEYRSMAASPGWEEGIKETLSRADEALRKAH